MMSPTCNSQCMAVLLLSTCSATQRSRLQACSLMEMEVSINHVNKHQPLFFWAAVHGGAGAAGTQHGGADPGEETNFQVKRMRPLFLTISSPLCPQCMEVLALLERNTAEQIRLNTQLGMEVWDRLLTPLQGAVACVGMYPFSVRPSCMFQLLAFCITFVCLASPNSNWTCRAPLPAVVISSACLVFQSIDSMSRTVVVAAGQAGHPHGGRDESRPAGRPDAPVRRAACGCRCCSGRRCGRRRRRSRHSGRQRHG